MMDERLYSAEEYRDWIIGCLRRFRHDEFISLICPLGEDAQVKNVLEQFENQTEPQTTFRNGVSVTKCPVCGSVLEKTTHCVPED